MNERLKPGAERARVTLVVREVVRHDLLKPGTTQPQGHPLVLLPIGAGRPTINLRWTLNPFNTHHNPHEEISSLGRGDITLLTQCIHWLPLTHKPVCFFVLFFLLLVLLDNQVYSEYPSFKYVNVNMLMLLRII